MIVQCSNCSTRFNVPDAQLGRTGRKVRCSRCQNTWHQMPEPENKQTANRAPPGEEDDSGLTDGLADELAALEAAINADSPKPKAASSDDIDDMLDEDELDLVAKRPADRRRRRRSRPRAPSSPISMGALAGTWVLLFFGILLFRESMIKTWPPVMAFFEAVGMPDDFPGRGLLIRENRLNPSLTQTPVGQILTVGGIIENVSANEVARVPILEGNLIGQDGSVLYTWQIIPVDATLEPGRATLFQSQLENPEVDAVDIQIEFTLLYVDQI